MAGTIKGFKNEHLKKGMLLALGPIGPWPPDFTSGPPSVAFYWPGLAIKLKGSNLVKKKK